MPGFLNKIYNLYRKETSNNIERESIRLSTLEGPADTKQPIQSSYPFRKASGTCLSCKKKISQEGISLAIMEAGLHKLPVIGSNVGGIPEIVKNDNTGYLISPYSNYKQLAEFIILLAQDEDKRKILGNNIHHLVNTNFNISIQAEKYIQEFYHAEK